jgi:hypothetical protein
MERSSFVFRIAATLAVLIASLMVSNIISENLGWQSRTYESDPWWLHNLLLLLTTFSLAMSIACGIWIHIKTQIQKETLGAGPRVDG